MRKRAATILVLALFALAVAATPAGAKKPDRPGQPGPEPSGGITCSRANVDIDSPWWDPSADVKTDDFQIVLTKESPDACVDVIPSAAGRWFVTVTPFNAEERNAGLRGLTIVPRDAFAPGDSCGGVTLKGDALYERPIPLPYFEDLNDNLIQDAGEFGDDRFNEIPLATINACAGNASPDGEFSELVERLDSGQIVVTEETARTDEEHPLALLIFSQGLRKAGDSVTIHVDLP